MAEHKVELAVVGAGPGGYAAAFLAADLGMKVVLVDKEPDPGGVCLYRGCIPSKALLHVAKLMAEVEDARQMGVDYPAPQVDLDKLRGWKHSVVERLTGGLGQLSRRRKIEYVQGSATFRDAHTIEVARADGESDTILFAHAVVATGSRPAVIPALALDSPRVLDSTSALDIDSVPDSLLVVGAGYIGLELGSVYAALGSRVSVVEMLPGILPGADRDLVNVLKKRLDARFESIAVNTTVASMTEKDGGVAVTFEGVSQSASERLRAAVLAHAAGPAVLRSPAGVEDPQGTPEAEPAQDAPSPAAADVGELETDASAPGEGPAADAQEAADPAPDRRAAPRRAISRHIFAMDVNATRVLMGRDISIGGMRVDPNPALSLGDELQIAIHVRAREEPLVVKACVSRDDREQGLVLRFRELSDADRQCLEQMIGWLPILTMREDRNEDLAVIVSEILEGEAG